MSSLPKPMDRSSIFAESNRIVAGNYRHFLILSSLFIFPLFISLTSLLSFILSQSFLLSCDTYSIALSLLYTLLVLSLYVAGVATITYLAHHGRSGKPLNLSSIITSLSKSFFPLVSTTLTSIACLLFVSIAFLLFLGSLLNSLQILGIYINYSSKFGLTTFSVILGLFLIFFHVHLILAAVISVIESKGGFEPLRRSFILIQGMKRSSISLLLLRGISIWIIELGLCSQFFTNVGSMDYLQVLKIYNISLFWTMSMTPSVIAYAVLYLNCKDLHEESGIDIGVEISKECISLAIDDKKLVRESSVKVLVFLAMFMLSVGSVTLVLVARFGII